MSNLNLFGFQQEDVDKLAPQMNVLNANEMGTGKTYEAIELDNLRREGLPLGPRQRASTLVVAPLTILEDVWQTHFEELTDLPVTVVAPKARDGSWMDFKLGQQGHGVFCVHWEGLRLMPELAEHGWLHVIADEVHRAKDRKAQQTRHLKLIKDVRFKTAMSGTPVVNRPDELWSILNWLYPRRYGSYWAFYNRYVEYEMVRARGGRWVKKVLGPKNEDQLLAEIAPFYVRRLKEDVLKDLPPKYYTVMHVDLTPTQKRAYTMMRDDMLAWIGEQESELLAAPVVIAQLTRLQQFADAYAEWDPETKRVRLAEPSAKLDALIEVLDEAGDTSTVVFTRFKSLVRLLGKRLDSKAIPWVAFTGDTPQDERSRVVSRFQKGHARVFVGTIAAGGVGITLHRASRVVFLDRDWSPALNAQAEDRLHRIGQENAVQVIDIMARGTVDAGRNQKLELKKSWIRRMLGDK